MLLYSESELAILEGRTEEGLTGLRKIAANGGPLASKALHAVSSVEGKQPGRKIASLSRFPGLIEPKVVQ
jgi:hypothetical protein